MSMASMSRRSFEVFGDDGKSLGRAVTQLPPDPTWKEVVLRRVVVSVFAFFFVPFFKP